MKAVQVKARGQAEFIDVAKPTVLPGHVLIRTCYLSLCGSDIQMLHHRAASSYPFPPGTTGHEMVGVVEALGDDKSEFAVGDRVLSLAPGHRAMCEYYLAPHHDVVPLPQNLPMPELLQAQQLSTVLYAAQRLPSLIGKNVAIIGQGSAGLWFNFHLRRMGARQVVALDIDDVRLERARPFGATGCFNNLQVEPVAKLETLFEGELADVVVEAAGEVDAINLAIDLVRKYGDILYFGYPRAQTMPFEFDKLFQKCCRATTIVGSNHEEKLTSLRLAIELIASGEADAKALITHHLPFADVIDAYELHRTRSDGAVKIVIEMPGASA